MANSPSSNRRRTQVACTSCRLKKIKCSGDRGDGLPCEYCARYDELASNCKFERMGATPLSREQVSKLSARTVPTQRDDPDNSNRGAVIEEPGDERLSRQGYPSPVCPSTFVVHPTHQQSSSGWNSGPGEPGTDPSSFDPFPAPGGLQLQNQTQPNPSNHSWINTGTETGTGYKPGLDPIQNSPATSGSQNQWYQTSPSSSSLEHTWHNYARQYPFLPEGGSEARETQVGLRDGIQSAPPSFPRLAFRTIDDPFISQVQYTQGSRSTAQSPTHGLPNLKPRGFSFQEGRVPLVSGDFVPVQRGQPSQKHIGTRRPPRA